MATRIKIRNDTGSNWAARNPILAKGEIGLVIEGRLRRAKVGDGITPWNALDFAWEAGGGTGGATAFADLTDKASADLPAINTPLATALWALSAQLSGKAPSFGIAPSAISGTAVITTDPRLSDARTPTAHTHPASEISDATATGRSILTAANQAAARSSGLGSGATGDALFTALTPAAARTTLGVWTFTKPSDESRSSTTTYAVDSHLKDIPLEAGKSYKIELFLAAYVPLTEGGKARLVVPLAAGTVPIGAGFHATASWGNGNATQISQTTSGSVRYFQLAAAAGYNQNRSYSGVAYTGVLSASGVLSLEWAQNTSGANATIMLGGSIITVTEL